MDGIVGDAIAIDDRPVRTQTTAAILGESDVSDVTAERSLLAHTRAEKVEPAHLEAAPQLVHAVEYEPVALIGLAHGLDPACSSKAILATEIPLHLEIRVAGHRQAVDGSHTTRVDWLGVVIVGTGQGVRDGGLPSVAEALRDGGLQRV